MEDVVLIKCPKCGLEKPASSYSRHICEDCEKALNNRYSLIRNTNEGWMDVAADSGLELYERQPKETQLEWSIWQAYRDSYPGAKPSYAKVAELVDTTYAFVKQTARRWNFQVRMEAWISECDRITIAQRRQEVLDMNAQHIDMAQRLRAKMSEAIDLVDPSTLSPRDLNSLLKTVTDLENKARLTNVDQEVALREASAEATLGSKDDPNIKKSPTKTSDLSEVVSILMNAGALGNITQIGVREVTTTTREVLAANNDSSVVLTQEDD